MSYISNLSVEKKFKETKKGRETALNHLHNLPVYGKPLSVSLNKCTRFTAFISVYLLCY